MCSFAPALAYAAQPGKRLLAKVVVVESMSKDLSKKFGRQSTEWGYHRLAIGAFTVEFLKSALDSFTLGI
jgi:hypothetical protein